MGSVRRRIERLEELYAPEGPESEEAALRLRLLRATTDELAKLKRSRAVGFKEEKPRDIPGRFLSKPYTLGDLIDLAITRVWEREDLDEDLMGAWTEV